MSQWAHGSPRGCTGSTRQSTGSGTDTSTSAGSEVALVLVWLREEAIEAWTPANSGCRGGQRRYSNVAIGTALTLRLVFRLPLRQTEGFVAFS
jgi:hypothetical protein